MTLVRGVCVIGGCRADVSDRPSQMWHYTVHHPWLSMLEGVWIISKTSKLTTEVLLVVYRKTNNNVILLSLAQRVPTNYQSFPCSTSLIIRCRWFRPSLSLPLLTDMYAHSQSSFSLSSTFVDTSPHRLYLERDYECASLWVDWLFISITSSRYWSTSSM